MMANPDNHHIARDLLLNEVELTSVEIEGFKSVRDTIKLEIGSLNILCGANSSGKSAYMQPLLLLKQTLEASYTPDMFKLSGSNVTFDYYSNFLNIDTGCLRILLKASGINNKQSSAAWQVYLNRIDSALTLGHHSFKLELKSPIYSEPVSQELKIDYVNNKLERYSSKEYDNIIYGRNSDYSSEYDVNTKSMPFANGDIAPFLAHKSYVIFPNNILRLFSPADIVCEVVNNLLSKLIHLQCLRTRSRYFPATSVSSGTFPGHFEDYMASLIMHWAANHADKLEKLVGYLADLELGAGVRARKFTDDQLMVETRLANSDHYHNIVDMGVGVSQILPVLVALVQADKGDTVYIEQPEIHLHPNAQYKFGAVLGKAITSNKARIIIETHSSLLIEGIQTEIARGKINHEDVRLHWFSLEDGVTKVSTVTPTEHGTLPEWKADFDSVYLRSMDDFMTEQDKRHSNS